MKRKRKITLSFYSLIALVGTSLVACSSAHDTEEKVSISVATTTPPTVPMTTTTVKPTTTTTTTTQPTLPEGFSMPTIPADVPCQEWTQVALDAGWPYELLPHSLPVPRHMIQRKKYPSQ